MRLLAAKYFVFMILSTGAWATGEEITQGLEALLNGGSVPSTCPPTQASSPSCSLVAICSELSSERNRPYLKDGGPGQRIRNAKWLSAAGALVECGRDRDYFQTASGSGFDPNSFDSWLTTQPNDVVASMYRARLALADKVFTEGLPRKTEGQSAQEFNRGRITAALAHSGVADSSALTEAVNRYADFLVDSERYYDTRLDYSKLPAEIRDLMSDPIVNPMALHAGGEVGQKAKVTYRSRIDQGFLQIEEVRRQVLKALDEQITRYPARRSLLEEMKSRVSAVTTSFAATPEELSNLCATPNAFYNPVTHSIKICPQYLDMTASMLVTVAHEFAHAVDPCSFSNPLYRGESGELTVYSIRDLVSEAKAGEVAGASLASRGAAYAQHPFTEVLACLATEDSLAAPAATLEVAQRLLRNQIENLRRRGLATLELEKVLADLPKTYDQHRGCSALPGKVQQGEAFSDWLSAEAMKGLAPNLTLADLAADFVGEGECSKTTPVSIPQVEKILRSNDCLAAEEAPDAYAATIYQLGGELDALATQELGPHPPTVDRINRLYALQPELRRRMGCEGRPSEGKYCAP